MDKGEASEILFKQNRGQTVELRKGLLCAVTYSIFILITSNLCSFVCQSLFEHSLIEVGLISLWHTTASPQTQTLLSDSIFILR